jgi:hypothetical protein
MANFIGGPIFDICLPSAEAQTVITNDEKFARHLLAASLTCH